MKFLSALTIAIAALTTAACGSSSSDGSDSVSLSEQQTDPVDLEHGNRHLTPAQLDELVNHPDELTPGEGVGALEYLYHRVQQSSGQKREEAMRRYNDFYNIMIEIYGSQFRAAVEKFNRKDTLNLASTYDDFHTVLVVGDDMGGATDDEEHVDSIKTYSDSTTTIETVIAE